MSEIAFIGLGTMGLPMAENLAVGGHRLHLLQGEEPLPPALLERGAQAHPSLSAMAEAAEIVVLMLNSAEEVEAALFGEGGAAGGLSRGKLVIDMGSVPPDATQVFAARVGALGCDYLDAPVSGGVVGAREASLSIMVGGPAVAFERARPLFILMGESIHLVGTANGDGQTCKMASQILVSGTLEAVAEALVFATKGGADPARVRQALLTGVGSSRVLEIYGQRMITRDFEPGFPIAQQRRDLEVALETAQRIGVELPNTASTLALFGLCVEAGQGSLDLAALVRELEARAGVRIGRRV